MKLSGTFIIALAILFFGLGFNALQEAKPSQMNKRIYKELKPFIPYYLEKRIGGFSILSKEDNIKEKPPITEVFRRLEQLERGWGMKHLKIQNNILIVSDNNNTIVKKIPFKDNEEKIWTKNFFGIKSNKENNE